MNTRHSRKMAQARRNVKLVVSAFSLAVLFAAVGFCQTSRSSISGYVTDPKGLAIPGAHITITEESTQVKGETNTDHLGFYQLLDLTPGTYTVTAQSQGFQEIQRTGVHVRTTESVRVDLPLQIGTTTQHVDVVAGTELIQTVSADLSGVVPSTAIEDLPQAVRYTMNDTFVWAYLALDSGTMFANGMSFSFHGSSQPAETVDSGAIGPLGSYNGPSGPNIEMVGEVKVLTSATSAEYRQPAIFDMSSKAGTNVFHGAGYWYNHTDGTDARNYFQPSIGYVTENTFGATLGGPIMLPKYNGHNRSFFLVSLACHLSG